MTHRALMLAWTLSNFGALAENNSSAEPYSLQLVEGVTRCQGILEVQRMGLNWAGVFPFGFHMHLANRVCAELDCGSALSVEWRPRSVGGLLIVLPNNCENTSLIHCFGTDPNPPGYKYVELKCSDSVRLVSKQSGCSGSLQVWNQSWTSVCEGALNRQGAVVLCRELNCGAPHLQEALSPLKQTLRCEGEESALMDCPRKKSGTIPGTCSGPALNFSCSEPVKLERKGSRCAGTVMVTVRGEWRRVTIYGFTGPLELEAVATVCRDLECGAAVSGEVRDGFKEDLVETLSIACLKRNTVRDCAWTTIRKTKLKTGMDVVCSDLLNIPVISVSEEVSAARPQGGVRVLVGADFWVRCSVEPQYPAGSFQLLSPTSNVSLEAVSHTAQFNISKAGYTHIGNYTCVYHLHVFNHSFSSQSPTLQIDLGMSSSQLLLRVLIVLLMHLLYIIPSIYCYCQASRNRWRSPRRASS